MNCDECGSKIKWHQRELKSLWAKGMRIHAKCAGRWYERSLKNIWSKLSDNQREESILAPYSCVLDGHKLRVRSDFVEMGIVGDSEYCYYCSVCRATHETDSSIPKEVKPTDLF